LVQGLIFHLFDSAFMFGNKCIISVGFVGNCWGIQDRSVGGGKVNMIFRFVGRLDKDNQIFPQMNLQQPFKPPGKLWSGLVTCSGILVSCMKTMSLTH